MYDGRKRGSSQEVNLRKLAERNNARVTEGDENEQSSTPDYAFTTTPGCWLLISLSFDIKVPSQTGCFMVVCIKTTKGGCRSIGTIPTERRRASDFSPHTETRQYPVPNIERTIQLTRGQSRVNEKSNMASIPQRSEIHTTEY